jgi:hypothetical protein
MTIARGPPPQRAGPQLGPFFGGLKSQKLSLLLNGAARAFTSAKSTKLLMTVSFRGTTVTNRTMRQEHFGHMGIGIPTRSSEMKQVLGLAVALVLLGSGVWANLGGGSLFQNTGAWAAHAIR